MSTDDPPVLAVPLPPGLFSIGHGMTDEAVSALRQDARDLFYHGYNNYMDHAFPEDELKPISCEPQTRNREDPADTGLNDVLGNYSLTLIDSLSTLAILASGKETQTDGQDALNDFQQGARALTELYGDGRAGSCGSRSCGFDLDSKVQVFETNIRGVGGLLSSHLFAMGELPIRGYEPKRVRSTQGEDIIQWDDGFVYDGQLLRLAHNLASRLLPAFSTQTDLPYPRVNLRHGTRIYQQDPDIEATGFCYPDGTSTSPPRETTETCTAGAGSLILEFTVLSRLTDDPRFEIAAKKAFWAIWRRRSSLDLVGGGIDAESGIWTTPSLAGIGAGVDSFFEYALKGHILLSNLPADNFSLGVDHDFLAVWHDAHAAVKRHIQRSNLEKHPYYGLVDMVTGAPRFSWIDNLSAFYPGLLTVAGHISEAIQSHLLFSALWTRYSALPERWQVPTASIDPHFRHWAGRPEFIESTYLLYQATKDPFYLHVGEMTLRDIRRRCWVPCGWTDLRDVVSGEKRDRMESFFLGETAKYLYLLFDAGHPLNTLDGAVVFTTEGHPLVIPRSISRSTRQSSAPPSSRKAQVCPVPPAPEPLTASSITSRSDLFHPIALTKLHLVPSHLSRGTPLCQFSPSSPNTSLANSCSPANHTFYPWTLPLDLRAAKGWSRAIPKFTTRTLLFPGVSHGGEGGLSDTRGDLADLLAPSPIQKVFGGVLILSLSRLRLNLIEEPRSELLPDDQGILVEHHTTTELRITAIANWPLGRDEKVILSPQAVEELTETPILRKRRDAEMIDLILDVPTSIAQTSIWSEYLDEETNGTSDNLRATRPFLSSSGPRYDSQPTASPTLSRTTFPAVLPTGIGAASFPTPPNSLALPLGSLNYQSILFLDDELCTHTLPSWVVQTYAILVIRRGACSFSEKLTRIPTFAPPEGKLEIVVVLSPPRPSLDDGESNSLVRPLLDRVQHTPQGSKRMEGIPMAMVEGGAETWQSIATAVGKVRDGKLKIFQRQSKNEAGAGMGFKPRYWFESHGLVIGNLFAL